MTSMDIQALRKLLAVGDLPLLGRMDGRVLVESTGATLNEAARAARLSAVFTMENGSISRRLIELAATDARTIFRTAAGMSPITCLVGVVEFVAVLARSRRCASGARMVPHHGAWLVRHISPTDRHHNRERREDDQSVCARRAHARHRLVCFTHYPTYGTLSRWSSTAFGGRQCKSAVARTAIVRAAQSLPIHSSALTARSSPNQRYPTAGPAYTIVATTVDGIAVGERPFAFKMQTRGAPGKGDG